MVSKLNPPMNSLRSCSGSRGTFTDEENETLASVYSPVGTTRHHTENRTQTAPCSPLKRFQGLHATPEGVSRRAAATVASLFCYAGACKQNSLLSCTRTAATGPACCKMAVLLRLTITGEMKRALLRYGQAELAAADTTKTKTPRLNKQNFMY